MEDETVTVGESTSTYPTPTVSYTPPVAEDQTGEEWSSTDIMNVYNPYFGVKFNTGLNSYNPSEKTWEPENTTWVSNLSLDEKDAISGANSEDYAKEIMQRRKLYYESQDKLAQGNAWATIPLGFGAAVLDPTIVIPVGVTANATKAAYTLGAKSLRLATISAESAVVAMASATMAVGAERGSGINDMGYGTANLFSGLFAGGLPIMGSMLSGGYSSVKIAKSLTKDPKNFALLTAEITADKLGGTQLRTMYTKIMPDSFQSDVTFTAASNNKYVTLVSNRIDSPPIAVVDRNTGQPVAIGTTGQDYKLKFNGRQNLALGDMRGLQSQSTISNYDDFMVQVGKTVRNRSSKQDAAVYDEIEDAIAFSKSEIEPKIQKEVDALQEGQWVSKDGAATPEQVNAVLSNEQANLQYTRDVTKYNEEVKALKAQHKEYLDTNADANTQYKNELDTWYKEDLDQWKLETEAVDKKRQAWVDEQVNYDVMTGKGRNKKELKALKDKYDKEVDTIMELSYPVKPLKTDIADTRTPSSLVLPDKPIKPTLNPKAEGISLRKRTTKEIDNAEAAIRAKYDEELSTLIDAKKEEIYSNTQLEFDHVDPKVNEAAARMDTYYKEVLDEAHRLKIDELKNIRPTRHYSTRIFDFQKIREIDVPTLKVKIGAALKAHPANQGFSAKQLAASTDSIVKKLKDLDYTRDWADFNFMVPKELGTTSFLRSKKFKLDDRMLEDILVTNAEDVMGQYSYAQSGHFSANHAFPELQGIPRAEQIDKFNELFTRPLIDSGAPAKEVNALKNMFEDMLGTFRMAKDSNSATWKATRIANSVNSLTYGGGFALNTAAELGGLVMDGHVSNLMKTRLGILKETGTMFSGKGIQDPLVREFVLMGQMENLFDTHSLMKMSDTDTVFNVGKVEHNLNKANNEFFKYTGLRGATVALEAIVGPRIIHDIIDMGAKASLPLRHQKYLARIGLSHQDTVSLAKTLNRVGDFTDDGKIYGLNFDKWEASELDKITTAVGRGMRHTVIKGDSTYLPSFMIKPNQFNRLIFQFLRYPMAATETLLARGLNESSATWMAAIGTSAMMYSSVLYMREQGAIAIGALEERDAKFTNFWEDDEAAMKLFTASMAKVGNLGGAGIMVDRLSALSGVPTPGSEYISPDVLGSVLGPTFSRVPQLRNILEPMFTEGTISNRKQWNALLGMMPGATFPLVSEWLRTQVKENTY